MKIKRYISAGLAAIFCFNAIVCSAEAHVYDVHAGYYVTKNPSTQKYDVKVTEAKFVYRINSSAQSGFISYSNVYQYATLRNGISSKVKISVTNAYAGVPTITNQLNVNGANLDDTEDGFVLGRTIYYDENGTRVSGSHKVLFSVIEMNTSDLAKNTHGAYGSQIISAKHTFLHEVGHTLRLKHPEQSTDDDDPIEGHDIAGFPYAIMNQGTPGRFPYVSSEITEHDKACLRYKWEELL